MVNLEIDRVLYAVPGEDKIYYLSLVFTYFPLI